MTVAMKDAKNNAGVWVPFAIETACGKYIVRLAATKEHALERLATEGRGLTVLSVKAVP